MNPQDNTATQGANATQAGVAKQDTSTKKAEIETSRAFKKVEAKTFSIAPAGIFNAVVIEVAFIGTYTRTFTKGEETTRKDYEFVGFAFKFIDLNTGVENIIYSEVALSYVDGSRLRGYIEGLNPDFKEGDSLKKLLSGKCNITITHTQGKDKSGEAKTYANIVNIAGHNSNMANVTVSNSELHYFDILNDMANIEDGLNSKHRWLIQNKSHEYGANASSVGTPAPQAQPKEEPVSA
jgi:hypothetical protein